MRRSNSRGSRFNADDCKEKEEETDRAQDGCEEAGAQGREEKGRSEDEAESQKVASLVALRLYRRTPPVAPAYYGAQGLAKAKAAVSPHGGRGLLF